MSDILILWGAYFDDRKDTSFFFQLAIQNVEKHDQIWYNHHFILSYEFSDSLMVLLKI